MEPKRLQCVYPRFGEEATFILVESVKAGGAELKIVDPLILHESDKRDASPFAQEDKTF